MTVWPSMPAGGSSVLPRARAGRSRRSSRYMVMSSDPQGIGRPSNSPAPPASRPARRDSPGGDAEQQDVAGPVGPFEDLVGDPSQGPPDLLGFEYPLEMRAAGAVRCVARGGGGWGILAPARIHHPRAPFSL